MKKAIRFIAAVLAAGSAALALDLLVEGVPLLGIPDVEKVVRVAVEHADYPGELREYAEAEKIGLAVALLGHLRYSPLKGLTEDGRHIQITYVMSDGTERVVAANDYTVWWNGRPRAIKNESRFTKLCTAIFYPEQEPVHGEMQEPTDGDGIHGEGGPSAPAE